jgi:hypothetical protein
MTYGTTTGELRVNPKVAIKLQLGLCPLKLEDYANLDLLIRL